MRYTQHAYMIKYLLPLLFILAFSGCKPTEKGYKSAYDAALNKRQQTLADYDSEIPSGAGVIQSTDGPQLKEINGKNCYLLNERLRSLEGNPALKEPYNIAVACYKMPTNCKAQVSDLISQGYPAFGAQTGDEKFYVIISAFTNLEEAVEMSEKIKKKFHVFVGLPDSPVIIYSN